MQNVVVTALRTFAFAFFIRPFFGLWLGARVRGLEHLPRRGPVILVANHESHLDALFLLGMLPLGTLQRARAAAAADTFFRGSLLGLLARVFVGVLPVDRSGSVALEVNLAPCRRHLAAGGVLVLFPEGTRGDPEVGGRLRQGWLSLVEDVPGTAVVPVGLKGLGRALPKGSLLPLPLLGRAAIGAPLSFGGDRGRFLSALDETLAGLRLAALPAPTSSSEAM